MFASVSFEHFCELLVDAVAPLKMFDTPCRHARKLREFLRRIPSGCVEYRLIRKACTVRSAEPFVAERKLIRGWQAPRRLG